MSQTAPFITGVPRRRKVLRDSDRLFVWTPGDAILPECPATA
jgi:hypothetical protein